MISKRYAEIDELKGLAILLVICYHAMGVLSWGNQLKGNVGVDIFLILSGIGLTLGYPVVKDWKDFIFKRLGRLMPLYWLTLVIYIFLQYVFLHKTITLKDFIYHFLGIHVWIGYSYSFSINDSFWFISIIILMYLVYIPTSRYIHKEEPHNVLIIGLTLSLIFLIYYTQHNDGAALDHFPIRIPSFFIGIIMGMKMRNPSLNIKINLPLGILLLVHGYLLFHFQYLFPIFGFLFTLFYFSFSRATREITFFNPMKKILSFIGMISFELYLIHQPLIREYNLYFWTHIMGYSEVSPQKTLLGVVIALIFAILLSYFVHKLLSRNNNKATAIST